MLEIISIALISRHYNNLLAGYFGINKIKVLTNQKYYWPKVTKDVEAYIKSYNIC